MARNPLIHAVGRPTPRTKTLALSAELYMYLLAVIRRREVVDQGDEELDATRVAILARCALCLPYLPAYLHELISS
jgi:hypothetical protein